MPLDLTNETKLCVACGERNRKPHVSGAVPKTCDSRRCMVRYHSHKGNKRPKTEGCERCEWPGRDIPHRHPCQQCGAIVEGPRGRDVCRKGECVGRQRAAERRTRNAPPDYPPAYHNEHCRVCRTLTLKVDQHWHKCLTCDLGFTAKQYSREYCSKACRMAFGQRILWDYAAYQARGKCRRCQYPWLTEDDEPHTHKCAECREVFHPPGSAIYCADSCRSRAIYRREKGDDGWMGDLKSPKERA